MSWSFSTSILSSLDYDLVSFGTISTPTLAGKQTKPVANPALLLSKVFWLVCSSSGGGCSLGGDDNRGSVLTLELLLRGCGGFKTTSLLICHPPGPSHRPSYRLWLTRRRGWGSEWWLEGGYRGGVWSQRRSILDPPTTLHQTSQLLRSHTIWCCGSE